MLHDVTDHAIKSKRETWLDMQQPATLVVYEKSYVPTKPTEFGSMEMLCR